MEMISRTVIGVVIRKDADTIILENPGYIRTGKDQMLRGGISDPRNKTLMKMFNMIGIGERAGSGVPDIFAVWESQGWKAPVVEEQYGPDRTILTLSFAKLSEENNIGSSHPVKKACPDDKLNVKSGELKNNGELNGKLNGELNFSVLTDKEKKGI